MAQENLNTQLENKPDTAAEAINALPQDLQNAPEVSDAAKLDSTRANVLSFLKPNAVAYKLTGPDYTLWHELNKKTPSSVDYIKSDSDHPDTLVRLCEFYKGKDTKLLGLEAFTALVKNAGDAPTALKALQDLKAAGFTETRMAELMSDNNFPWKQASELLSNPEVKPYLVWHRGVLANRIVELGADRFVELCAAFKKTPDFSEKSLSPNAVEFFTAVVYYGLEYKDKTPDAVASLAVDKVTSLQMAVDSSLFTDEDCRRYAALFPEVNTERLGATLNEVHRQMPDFYDQVMPPNADPRLSLLTLAPLLGKESAQDVVTSIKSLLSEGFEPLDVCRFAREWRNARDKGEMLPQSFSQMCRKIFQELPNIKSREVSEVAKQVFQSELQYDKLDNIGTADEIRSFVNKVKDLVPALAHLLEYGQRYGKMLFNTTTDPEKVKYVWDKADSLGMHETMEPHSFVERLDAAGSVYVFNQYLETIGRLQKCPKGLRSRILSAAVHNNCPPDYLVSLDNSKLSTDTWIQFIEANAGTDQVAFVNNLKKEETGVFASF